MNRRGEEGQRHSRINSSAKSSSRPKTPTSNASRGPTLKLPQISQFSIACYAGFIGLAALYVAHSSANTSADLAILANKIATAGLSQAQVANQIQLLQLCLLNSTLLTEPCDAVLAAAAGLVPKLVPLTNFQYGSTAANDQMEARFVRELMGFHIAFFSLLAIAVIHAIFSLWHPVKDYLRQRRVARRCSDAGTPSCEGKDGFADCDRAGGVLRAMGPDQDGEWRQTGNTEVEHAEVVDNSTLFYSRASLNYNYEER